AEFLQHYYDANGAPFRSKLIANFTKSQRLGSLVAPLYNFVSQTPILANVIKKVVGFAPARSLPKVYATTLRQWFKKYKQQGHFSRKVYLFCDEFTNYNDTEICICTVEIQRSISYVVMIPEHVESCSSYLSKSFLK